MPNELAGAIHTCRRLMQVLSTCTACFFGRTAGGRRWEMASRAWAVIRRRSPVGDPQTAQRSRMRCLAAGACCVLGTCGLMYPVEVAATPNLDSPGLSGLLQTLSSALVFLAQSLHSDSTTLHPRATSTTSYSQHEPARDAVSTSSTPQRSRLHCSRARRHD